MYIHAHDLHHALQLLHAATEQISLGDSSVNSEYTRSKTHHLFKSAHGSLTSYYIVPGNHVVEDGAIFEDNFSALLDLLVAPSSGRSL